MSDYLLEVKNLTKHFPLNADFLSRLTGKVRTLKAVDDISFFIKQGETLGLVGESGCGKSTTARLVTRLIEPTGGEVLLRGEDLRKIVGYSILPSARFEVESVGSDVVFNGFGAGHGVGLCQWGAKEMAELGYSFGTILSYYYPGTDLMRVDQLDLSPQNQSSPS